MLIKDKKQVASNRTTLDNLPDNKNQPEPKKPESEIKLTPKKKKFNLRKYASIIKDKINKLTKKQKKIILIAIAAVIVLVGSLFLTMHFTSPVHLTKIETLLAISSRTENPPVQSDFAGNDPIMLHFEFVDAKVGTIVNFEIKDTSNGEVVKSGSTTVLRETGDDKTDGQRYVSIVNTASTALGAGKYRIVLSSGNREVGAINFAIIE